MTEYKLKPNELSLLLTSLTELHNELGEWVTPKILAERMSTKGQLQYKFHQASYMLRLFGFETKYPFDNKDRSRYIIWDEELVQRLQKELPQIEKRTEAGSVEESPYRSRLDFTNYNYFNAGIK